MKGVEADFDAGLNELREAEAWLGDVVPGYHPTIRKLRVAIPSERIIARGGLRLVYRVIPDTGELISVLVYYKKEKSDFVKKEFTQSLKAVRPQIEPALVRAGLSQKKIDDLFTP